MHLSDVFHDREAQARSALIPASCLVDAIEALEDAIKLVGVDSRAFVDDLDLKLPVFAVGVYKDGLAVVAVFHRVVDEIHEALFQKGGIHRGRELGGALDLNADGPTVGLVLAQFHCGFDDR
jgi:hypothetical protein